MSCRQAIPQRRVLVGQRVSDGRQLVGAPLEFALIGGDRGVCECALGLRARELGLCVRA